MKIKLLHSTFDERGHGSNEQHLTCYLIDGRLAIDAGSLAIAISEEQRGSIRDIIITHPHLDHIASLPIFIDSLFETLREPIRIHASREAIESLEKHIFNWEIYPRFSELRNDFGKLIEYAPFELREEFSVAGFRIKAIPVTHQVPTVGLIISDQSSIIALSSDTAETEELWHYVNKEAKLDALLIESSFPDELHELAKASYHLTPSMLRSELKKLRHPDAKIMAVHLKPAYFDIISKELNELGIENLEVMQAGKDYNF